MVVEGQGRGDTERGRGEGEGVGEQQYQRRHHRGTHGFSETGTFAPKHGGDDTEASGPAH
jgi:hypothetical protein